MALALGHRKLPRACQTDIIAAGVEAASAGNADVAQLAEQLFCKQPVAGSSPIVGSNGTAASRRRNICNGQLPEWTIGADCKSAARASAVRIRHCPPDRLAPWPNRAHIAQLVEHILGKNEVTGSSPVVGSSLFKPLRGSNTEPFVLFVTRFVWPIQCRRPGGPEWASRNSSERSRI